MTAHEHVEPHREPPEPGAYVAALLEISMLSVFAWHQSIAGALLWLVYFRFSATRALVGGLFVPRDKP